MAWGFMSRLAYAYYPRPASILAGLMLMLSRHVAGDKGKVDGSGIGHCGGGVLLANAGVRGRRCGW